MNRILILSLAGLIFVSCGADETGPKDLMSDFINELNEGKDISSFGNSPSISKDYLETRKISEKLDPDKISCETDGETAECICETESGKKRKFNLYNDEGEWKIDFKAPEITLELFHIHYNTSNTKAAKKYATPTELDRLKVFESLLDGVEFDASKVTLAPFEISCKKFKKKYECNCKSEDGETAYLLFMTSDGWKAELGETDISYSDSLIDYNSSENFNLNQHDLDSLTNFSQKMLDSMLNL